MKNLLLILALFVGNIFSNYYLLQLEDKDLESIELLNSQKEFKKISIGDTFFSNRATLKNRIFLKREDAYVGFRKQCSLRYHYSYSRDFRPTTFSLEKTKKDVKPKTNFVRRDCLIMKPSWQCKSKRLDRVAYCLSEDNEQDISQIKSLEVYEFFNGIRNKYAGNNVRKTDDVILEEQNLSLIREDRFSRGFALKLKSISSNKLSFWLIGSAIDFNHSQPTKIYKEYDSEAGHHVYEIDLNDAQSLILIDKDGISDGYEIMFKDVSLAGLSFKINNLTRAEYAKYEEERKLKAQQKEFDKYLSELINRCITIYGFKEEENLKRCVQQEAFNDKQLAMLSEQNQILKEQNRMIRNQNETIAQNSINRNSTFLNAFIGGLTSGLISNAIQNRNTQPTIIYRNNPPPRFYTD
jgi:predicted transcriptional regulator